MFKKLYINLFISAILVAFPLLVFAQKDAILFSIVAINDIDGVPIKKSEIIVLNDIDSKIIKPTLIKNELKYQITTNQKITIKVNATGFYSEEKHLLAENINLEDVIELRLRPKSSGSISISTIDGETNELIESELEIIFFSKKSGGKITSIKPEFTYLFDLNGKYKINSTANGYLNDTKEIDLDLSTNKPNELFVIKLTKNRIKQHIEVLDKSTNSILKMGNLLVTHETTNQIIFEGKILNGKVSFNGNKNEAYLLEIKAEGFTNLKESFKMEGKLLKFGLIPNSSVAVDIFDEIENKRIAIDVEVLAPSLKKTKIKTSDKETIKFFPKEIGTYTFSSKANGYINKSGNIKVTKLDGGNTFFTLRISKGSNDFEINVFDFVNKNPINNAVIKIFNDQSKEILGKLSKNQKTVTLEGGKKHFFEVTALDYYDYTANIEMDKSIKVFLKKKQAIILEKFEFKIVDEQTKIPLKEPRLRIFDLEGKPIPVNFDPTTSQFTAKNINMTLSYSLEASAKGYNLIKEDLQKANKNIIISLSPAEILPYTFSVIDSFTKKEIQSDLKLFSSNKEIEMQEISGKKRGMLSNTNEYKIALKSIGYFEKEINLNRSEAPNKEFKLSLLKENYEVLVKLNSKLTEKDINNAKIKLIEKQTDVSQNIEFDLSKNGFSISLKPTANYLLEIDIVDFEKQSSSLFLKQVNPETMELLIAIKRKKKEIEKTVKKEEIETLIQKNITDKPKEQLIKKSELLIDSKVKVVHKNEDRKTTKYNVDKVIFEKSSPVIIVGSEQQLNDLAKILIENSKYTIEITGHTDNEGTDPRLNIRLSEFRAKLVANYLFNKGVSMDRITTFGKGAREPLATNDTEENKMKNRRVEINLIED